MNSFQIYNPKTKEIDSYTSSSEKDAQLTVEDFTGQSIYFFQSNQSPQAVYNTYWSDSEEVSTDETTYCHLVSDMIREIQENKFEKLVAAQRQVLHNENNSTDFNAIFQNLVQHFPDTFVYLLSIDGEVWLGASPEIIGLLDHKQFTTISLAGTKMNEPFTQKEIDEQRIVSDTISKQLDISSDQTKTTSLRYGNITHLINEYHIPIPEDFDFTKTIHDIHPSPALVGYPKNKAISYLKEREGLDRKFYCGLVHQKKTPAQQYSFAMIRCARFTKNQIIFYAGAGITIDSNPQKEWEETLHKINALQSIIRHYLP